VVSHLRRVRGAGVNSVPKHATGTSVQSLLELFLPVIVSGDYITGEENRRT